MSRRSAQHDHGIETINPAALTSVTGGRITPATTLDPVLLQGIGELAQAIISHRASSGFFANTGWLLRVPGMTRDIFKQVAPLVTARSETYRIISEGKVASSGTRQRLEVIVRVGYKDIDTLSYREDL